MAPQPTAAGNQAPDCAVFWIQTSTASPACGAAHGCCTRYTNVGWLSFYEQLSTPF